MNLLCDYQTLSQKRSITEIEDDPITSLNPLDYKLEQIYKIQRKVSSKLAYSNLTFDQSLENLQFDSKQTVNQNLATLNTANKVKIDVQNYLNFSLIAKSDLSEYEILIKFSINIKRFTITFESKILHNHRLLKIQSKNLVKYLSKYFMSYNGKLKQGSFYVNPISCEISLFIHNYSSLESINKLIRNPQKFLVFIMFYIDQTTSKWTDCLESILHLLNRKSMDEIKQTKKNNYMKEKVKRIGQMVIHSHNDQSFFIQNKSITRFQKLGQEERKHKVVLLKNEYAAMQKRCKPLQKIRSLLRIYIGDRKYTQSQFQFEIWQKPQKKDNEKSQQEQNEKKIRQREIKFQLLEKEISANLCCKEYGAKSIIYSEIEILKVLNENCIFQSGFSKIYQIEAQIKRQEQNPVKALLIKKKTQEKRYKNQISVLKIIQKEKFLFLPRYYFCQQDNHKQSIFVQFIPDSSLDRYVMSKSAFMGIQTKLFFLFMIVIALRFLRDNLIVHIDLKPENALIKIVGDGNKSVHYLVKLIDYGQSYSSKINSSSSNTNRGFTIPYAPPELLSKSKRFDEKSDVYSFGIIMFKLIFNHFPRQIMKLNKQDFIEENYLKFYTIPPEKLQTFGPKQLMSQLYYLCLKCIQPNPNDRPTLDWLCIIIKDMILIYDEMAK